MTFPRYKANEILNSDIKKPDSLDYIEFNFHGVTFRCFGILHGITGGLNRDYREFVKTSIRSIDGIKLAEKGMKQLYSKCGIDAELEDWAVLRPIDCLTMGFQLLADPRCVFMITVDTIREQLRKDDPFTVNSKQNISDLGESTYFHYLDEQERRGIAGFLPSQEAITNDLQSMSHWYGAIIPKRRANKLIHPQWRRLLLLERVMHIPCRSIHMLHYALAYAKQHHHKTVNLLVGETHNSDMQYIATQLDDFVNQLSNEQRKVMNDIINRSSEYGQSTGLFNKIKFVYKKTNYFIFLLLGASLALVAYTALFSALKPLLK